MQQNDLSEYLQRDNDLDVEHKFKIIKKTEKAFRGGQVFRGGQKGLKPAFKLAKSCVFIAVPSILKWKT